MLTLGSLFDGSGGFPLAGMICGIKPIWASEIEPFPIRVTTRRFPEMKHYGDISEMNGAEVEPVHIITFGSPCQDLSVAGLRKGLEGKRSNLFYQAVRIIKEMRDVTGMDTVNNVRYGRYAIWENVPGAFSSNGGEDFRCVLEELANVKGKGVTIPKPKKWEHSGCIMADDYSIAWRVLDAQYFGVPQRRKRIFLVADFDGQRAGEILFKREGLRWNPAESVEAWQGASGSPENCIDIAGGDDTDGIRCDGVDVEKNG